MKVITKQQKKSFGYLHTAVNETFENNSALFSKQKLIKHKSKQFLPFIHERDGIGRLIKSTNLQQSKNNVPFYLLTTQSKIHEQNLRTNNQQPAQKQINYNSFKKKKLYRIHQATKSQRKKFITKELEKNYKSSSLKSLPAIHANIKNQQQIRAYQLEYKFKKNPCCTIRKQSLSKFSRYEQPKQTIQCSHLTKIKSKSLCSLPTLINKKVQQYQNDQNMLTIPKSAIKITYDLPQFERLKQMMKLSMKTIDNFDQSHEDFIKKYNYGRMLAAKFRNQLQY